MTKNMEEGYLDGLAGRNNAMRSPNYCEGWDRGWRERMLALNNLSQPIEAINI